MIPRRIRSRIAAALLAPCCWPLAGAGADEVTEFYKGKSINLNVPAGPGTGFSLFSKLLADHMPRHMPGNPNLVTKFRPGGGGLTNLGYMAQLAPRDGTEISLLLSTSVLLAIINPEQAKVDARQVAWLGSMFPRTGAVWLWHQAPATTLEGARRTELSLGSAGVGSETYQTPRLMNALLGTRFRIVTGYPSGAEINLAIERGEINGRQQNYLGWEAAGRHAWLKEKKVIAIMQSGPREPALGDVPMFNDLVQPADRPIVELHEIAADMGMGVYTTPGVPADRLAALRKAFAAAMADPQLVAEATRSDVAIKPRTPDRMAEIVASGYAHPKAVRDRLSDILSAKQ